jgi:hypothetical protein
VRELRRLGARDRWISAGAAGQWSSEPNDVAARRDPIREWRDGFARGMHSIDFAPVPEAPFHASVVPILHGVRTTLSAGFTFRDDELVKDSGGDAFSLVLSRSKNLEVAHAGMRFGSPAATRPCCMSARPAMSVRTRTSSSSSR